MRKARSYLIGLVAGVVLALGVPAAAQVANPVPKHYACVAFGTNNAWKTWYYLDKTRGSCPFGHTEIDWIDD